MNDEINGCACGNLHPKIAFNPDCNCCTKNHGRNDKLSNVVCPGSCEENYHTLRIISHETDNLFCRNEKCFFIYIDPDKNHYWENGFDPMSNKSFVKSASQIVFKDKDAGVNRL